MKHIIKAASFEEYSSFWRNLKTKDQIKIDYDIYLNSIEVQNKCNHIKQRYAFGAYICLDCGADL